MARFAYGAGLATVAAPVSLDQLRGAAARFCFAPSKRTWEQNISDACRCPQDFLAPSYDENVPAAPPGPGCWLIPTEDGWALRLCERRADYERLGWRVLAGDLEETRELMNHSSRTFVNVMPRRDALSAHWSASGVRVVPRRFARLFMPVIKSSSDLSMAMPARRICTLDSRLLRPPLGGPAADDARRPACDLRRPDPAPRAMDLRAGVAASLSSGRIFCWIRSPPRFDSGDASRPSP